MCPACPVWRSNVRALVEHVVAECVSASETHRVAAVENHARLLDEATFQRCVEAEMQRRGAWTMHVRKGRTARGMVLTPTSRAGWPDVVAILPPDLWLLELKAHGGVTSPDQEEVMRLLQRCGDGVHAFVVQPHQFGRLVERLNRATERT